MRYTEFMTTTKTTKRFSKGDLVTVCSNWSRNDRNPLGERRAQQRYTYRFCEVKSWGKKQGTLADTATGDMIKVQVHTGYDSHILPGHDATAALVWATTTAADDAARTRSAAAHWLTLNDSHSPKAATRLELEAAEIESGDWSLLDYTDAIAEIDARIAAR